MDKGRQREAIESSISRSPLSQSQFLIWLGQQMAPADPLYNMALSFRIKGHLQPERFQQTFSALVEQYDVLRTVIKMADDTPFQVVLPQANYTLSYVDFSAQNNPEKQYTYWLQQRIKIIFQLDECLTDSVLLKLADDHYVWYLNQHHIITDAVSMSILYHRQLALYFASSGPSEMPQLANFRDYLEHERKQIENARFQSAKDFWKQKLKHPFKETAFYVPNSIIKSNHTQRVTIELGLKRSESLRAIAVHDGIRSFSQELSLFHIFATLLLSCLHKINGQQQLSIGVPFANRSIAFKQTPGLFMEIHPLRIEISEMYTLLDLLKKIAATTQEAFSYALPGLGSAESNRAYDVLLNFITCKFGDFGKMPATSEWIHSGFGDNQHKLRLQVHDFNADGSFTLHFDLQQEFFPAEHQQWLVKHFLHIVDVFINDPATSIGKICLLDEQEQQRYLLDYNNTKSLYPEVNGVISLIEQQVQKTPQAIALSFNDQDLSYEQLNFAANGLAKELLAAGVAQDQFVAIYMPRCFALVIAILATLKVRGAYLPLDPAYPEQRIQFVVDDLVLAGQENLLFITNQQIFSDSIMLNARNHIILNDVLINEHIQQGLPNPDQAVKSSDLAYILYTSGSSGLPKGTLIEQGGLFNYICWAKKTYQQEGPLDFPLYSSLSFDLTVTSLFVPLVSGSRLVIYQNDEQSGAEIIDVLKDDRVDIIKLTPSHLALMLELGLKPQRLKKLICGGEDLKRNLALAVTQHFTQQVHIYNEYGPTETVVGCMIHCFDAQRDQQLSVPIGVPAANVQIYLLDAYQQPVPAGVIGEMVIAGEGVARGYLNQAELTAEKFIDNPWHAGKKMYRSGDMAYWDNQGRMVFLGRADQQLKVNGARIEPGEIETSLLAHDAIKECVVAVVDNQNKTNGSVEFCQRCGLPSNYPAVNFDNQGVCTMCLAFDEYKDKIQPYFKTRQDLQQLFTDAGTNSASDYDCMMLLSGGKDSTYALYQLANMGVRILVFCLDNGYIAEGAKANIRRATDDLGVDLVFATTEHMPAIFSDSLERHSNVCNGCFKTIYTLSMNMAREKGIKYIMTGLSRGQLFETRLMDLYGEQYFDVNDIDRAVTAARKAYHQIDDMVSSKLDVSQVQNSDIFEQIQFIDFYRYCDVELSEMYQFLKQHAPWIRPEDTGRSTNCLINDVGIYIHKKQRGFHNYALPYSWDVRLGHKTREETLAELDDEIDISKVKTILQEIGFQEAADQRLTVWYIAESPQTSEQLHAFLALSLPAYMLPTHFVAMESMPLTINGKINFDALPHPDKTNESSEYRAPLIPLEKQLCIIWCNVFHLQQVGVDDNFFDLGGDSIISMMLVVAAEKEGLALLSSQIFTYQTIAELAGVVEPVEKTVQVEQGPVTGNVPLMPVQHWFFEQAMCDRNRWTESICLQLHTTADKQNLSEVLRLIINHHDTLRSNFIEHNGEWEQNINAPLQQFSLSNLSIVNKQTLEKSVAQLQAEVDISAGKMLVAATYDKESPKLILVIHHLVLDGVSWRIILDDFQTVWQQLSNQTSAVLPEKTTAFKTWAEQLNDYAQQTQCMQEIAYWRGLCEQSITWPVAYLKATKKSFQSYCSSLSHADTHTLLRQVPGRYHCKIDAILLTALCRALNNWTGSSCQRIDMEGHGREENVLPVTCHRTVGLFSSLYPMAFTLEQGTYQQQVNFISQQMQAPEHNGMGYGVLRYLNNDPDIRKQLIPVAQAPIRFNFLGQYSWNNSAVSLFSIQGSIPLYLDLDHQPLYSMEVIIYIQQGQLQLQWIYNETLYTASVIERLASDMLYFLHQLISADVAPSTDDFPLADLNEKELSLVHKLLKQSDSHE